VVQIARYPAVLSILIAFFFIQLASQSYGTIWAFYTMEVAHWSKWAVGLSAGTYGLLMVLMQGGLTGPVIRRFGEWRALWFSIGAGIVSFLTLAFAGGPGEIYAGVVVGSFAGFFFPAAQSLMSKGIPENAQGELQGALASSFCVAAIISPILMTHLFSAFTSEPGEHFPGAPFLAAAALMVCALLALILRRSHQGAAA
jgi:DHA1 family tetracycline resistance protein-like MFS transporter